jgi:hypothetical protein
MKGQTRILPVDTTMIAHTLANIVGTKPPADLHGACFDIGFPGAPSLALRVLLVAWKPGARRVDPVACRQRIDPGHASGRLLEQEGNA